MYFLENPKNVSLGGCTLLGSTTKKNFHINLTFRLTIFFFVLQHLADILYQAAAEGGYIDPHKVQDILGVPNTDCAADETISGQCSIKKKRVLHGTNIKERIGLY